MCENVLNMDRILNDTDDRYLNYCNKCGKKSKALYDANQDTPRGYFCKNCANKIKEIW